VSTQAVTNLLTDWRVGVKSTLKIAFPKAEILDGERPSGTSRDKMRICVFASGISQWDRDANMAQPTMTIRLWCPFPLNQTTVPRNPAPIESAMMTLAAALQGVLVSLDGPDYFQVQSITPDYLDEYGVEALLVAWTRSPMMIGG